MINKSKFYDAIRPMFSGGLKPIQVNIIDAIIDSTEHLTDYELAYVLATAYGEADFTPKRENMSYSAARIRQVWPTRPEAVRFARRPKDLANSVYSGRLGNKAGTDDGWRYRGGGLDQTTGRVNYAKVGLESMPDAILEPEMSVKSIIGGMTSGRYTGLALRDFVKPDGFDFIGARAIMNGDVKLNGKKYAGYAEKFLAAIRASRVGDIDVPEPDPVEPPYGDGWLAALIKAIIALMRSK